MSEFINAGKHRQRLTYVCCISLTDQVSPLCSVNVFTETEILSQQNTDLRHGLPIPYAESFSIQKGTINTTRTYPKRDDQRIIKLWAFAFPSYPSLSSKKHDRHNNSISNEAAPL